MRVRGDRVEERREGLRLLLTGAHGLRIKDRVGRARILDDDPLPRLTLEDVTVTEPPEGSVPAAVRIALDRPRSRKVVMVVATRAIDAEVDGTAVVTITPPAVVPAEATRTGRSSGG